MCTEHMSLRLLERAKGTGQITTIPRSPDDREARALTAGQGGDK